MYLCQTTEIYRVNSEKAAADLISEAKSKFSVIKSSTEYKNIKCKGEIVEEYWKVTIVKNFNDIKNPDVKVDVSYEISHSNFPTLDEDEEEADE